MKHTIKTKLITLHHFEILLSMYFHLLVINYPTHCDFKSMLLIAKLR